MSDQNRKGSPLPETLRERLARHDDLEVIRYTGMSATAYWRARGGGNVHVGTMLRLEQALDVLDSEP